MRIANADRKTRGKLFVGPPAQAKAAHFFDLFSGKFCRDTIPTTALQVLVLMPFVLCVRAVFKVFQSVVMLVAVLVVYHSAFGIPKERGSNNAVNKRTLGDALSTQANRQIPGPYGLAQYVPKL